MPTQLPSRYLRTGENVPKTPNAAQFAGRLALLLIISIIVLALAWNVDWYRLLLIGETL